MITTKKGQVGKLQVGVSSGIEWLNAFKMPSSRTVMVQVVMVKQEIPIFIAGDRS